MRINSAKAKLNEENGAYAKMEQELQKLKLTMNKANDMKNIFTGLIGDVKRDKEIK